MRELSRKYKEKIKQEMFFRFPKPRGAGQNPSDTLFLGDVVISYPQVIREAAAQEILVDEKIEQLAEHGIMHLLGINHE